MTSWKMQSFSLASTLGVTYIFCAIFDALFHPLACLPRIVRGVRSLS